MKSKYRAKKVEVDGITFDSKRESKEYLRLKKLEQEGLISFLRLQVKYTLIPTQYGESPGIYARGKNKGLPKPGKVLERECSYIADFVYTDNSTGEEVVEDSKGFQTTEYKIKRKLMLYIHGIAVKEV